MIEKDAGSDFVSGLVEVTNSDKLIWENHNWQGQDFDIAYCSPWMLCLDNKRRPHPLLQVAKSYHCFVELDGGEYSLSPLMLAIAHQSHRLRCASSSIVKIEAGKIKKFLRDKLERDKREKMFREKILRSCQQSISSHQFQGR